MTDAIPADRDTALSNDAPLAAKPRGWTSWVGTIISICVLGAVAYQLRTLDFHQVLALVPTSPSYWLLFAVCYAVTPVSEWIIYRKLWSIPLSGLAALFRKTVSNELLLGYIGEVYFYAWVRRHGHISDTPFGAIKDVSILSALCGNVVTLAMVLVAYPLIGTLDLGLDAKLFAMSVGVIVVTSLAVMLFRKTLFSLPTPLLFYISGIHIVRILGALGLTALLWHLVQPEIAIGWWLLLVTFRQLVSRLPLLPNKDVLFVGIAIFLVGREIEIASLLAMTASVSLVAHLLVGGVLGIGDLVYRGRGPKG